MTDVLKKLGTTSYVFEWRECYIRQDLARTDSWGGEPDAHIKLYPA